MTGAMVDSYWPLLIYFSVVLVLLVVMLGLSRILGEYHSERATGEPYESGMVITGAAPVSFDVKFYLLAVFFVIFDLEVAFVIAWAIALKESGWAGFTEMVVFIGVLLAALIYLWRLGALDVFKPASRPDRPTHAAESVVQRRDSRS